MALKDYESGKISLINRIRNMTLPARIASISGAVLILVTAGTGAFLLTKQNRESIPASASQVSTVVSSKPAVTTLSLSQTSVSLSTEKTVQITATPEPVSTDEKVVWASSDEKVATVSSDGLVTAVSKGTCTVTASVGSTVSASVQVAVKDPGDEEIALLKAYLKNGIKTPTTSARFVGDLPIQVKKSQNAAIVDLDGDGHYEMLVEHFFVCKDENFYENCPFFELYYVNDGKVVKRSEDFCRTFWEYWMPAGLGNSTGSLKYYIAQDSKTKAYYLVEINAESCLADCGHIYPAKFTAYTLKKDQCIPIMKMHQEVIEHARDFDQAFTYFAENSQIEKNGFEKVFNRLKPVLFYEDEDLSHKINFNPDSVLIYKNNKLPTSFLPEIIKDNQKKVIPEIAKDGQKKVIPDPSVLLGMSTEQIIKTYGEYQQAKYTIPESTFSSVVDMLDYPYTLGIGCIGSNDSTVQGVRTEKNNANIYKNAKIGMTYSQIKSIFGDHIGNLESNMVDGDGTGLCEAHINNIIYSFYFDGVKASSKCQDVVICKQ